MTPDIVTTNIKLKIMVDTLIMADKENPLILLKQTANIKFNGVAVIFAKSPANDPLLEEKGFLIATVLKSWIQRGQNGDVYCGQAPVVKIHRLVM